MSRTLAPIFFSFVFCFFHLLAFLFSLLPCFSPSFLSSLSFDLLSAAFFSSTVLYSFFLVSFLYCLFFFLSVFHAFSWSLPPSIFSVFVSSAFSSAFLSYYSPFHLLHSVFVFPCSCFCLLIFSPLFLAFPAFLFPLFFPLLSSLHLFSSAFSFLFHFLYALVFYSVSSRLLLSFRISTVSSFIFLFLNLFLTCNFFHSYP